MQNTRFINNLLFAFNSILLLSATIAIVVFLIWTYNKQLVDRIDTYIVDKYTNYYSKKFNEAKALISSNDENGVIFIEQFIYELSDVRKLDRLHGLKRLAYNTIVQKYYDINDADRTLFWVKQWMEFDDRDLTAQVWHIKILRKAPSTIDIGWQLIQALYQKAPNSHIITNEYIEYLLLQKQYIEAFIAICNVYNKKDTSTGRIWQIFYDIGNGFNAGEMLTVLPDIDDSGRLSLFFRLPSETIQLRIDPPPNSMIDIINPTLIQSKEQSRYNYLLLENSLKMNQMTKQINKLSTFGGEDPFFYWDQIMFKSSTPVDTLFVCNLSESLPSTLIERIIPEIDPLTMEKRLNREGLHCELNIYYNLLKQYRKNSSENQIFEIFWKKNGEQFSQHNKIRKIFHTDNKDPAFQITFTFPDDIYANYIRIDLPDIVGKQYTIKMIDLKVDGFSNKVTLSQIDDRFSNSVAHNNNTVIVTDNDPYFVFPSYSNDNYIQSISIAGTLN